MSTCVVEVRWCPPPIQAKRFERTIATRPGRIVALTPILLVLAVGLLGSPALSVQSKRPRAARIGKFRPPIAELPLFARRPPATSKESVRIPPGVSMSMLPDGRVAYWGGLENLEDGASETNSLSASRALVAGKKNCSVANILDVVGSLLRNCANWAAAIGFFVDLMTALVDPPQLPEAGWAASHCGSGAARAQGASSRARPPGAVG